MKGTYLGEFEEVVLLTVGILYEKAYGVAIKLEIEKRLERRVSVGALHSSLYRLEKKGFLASELGEATKERGGKRKRYFTVTMEGKNALREVRNTREQLWLSIPDAAWQLVKAEQ